MKKQFMAFATAALVLIGATAAKAEDITLCVGESVQKTMNPNTRVSWSQTTAGNNAICSVSGFSTSQARSKTVTFKGGVKGSTTWAFNAATGGRGTTYTYNVTVTQAVSTASTVVGGSVNFTSKTINNSTNWYATVSPATGLTATPASATAATSKQFTFAASAAGNYTVTINGCRIRNNTTNNVVAIETVKVTVAKATPTVSAVAPAGDIYDGSALSTVTLSGTASVNGTFSWKEPATVVALADNGKSFPVVFTPTDADNYNTVETTAAVSVIEKLPTEGTVAVTVATAKDDSVALTTTATEWTTKVIRGTDGGNVSAEVKGGKVVLARKAAGTATVKVYGDGELVKIIDVTVDPFDADERITIAVGGTNTVSTIATSDDWSFTVTGNEGSVKVVQTVNGDDTASFAISAEAVGSATVAIYGANKGVPLKIVTVLVVAPEADVDDAIVVGTSKTFTCDFKSDAWSFEITKGADFVDIELVQNFDYTADVKVTAKNYSGDDAAEIAVYYGDGNLLKTITVKTTATEVAKSDETYPVLINAGSTQYFLVDIPFADCTLDDTELADGSTTYCEAGKIQAGDKTLVSIKVVYSHSSSVSDLETRDHLTLDISDADGAYRTIRVGAAAPAAQTLRWQEGDSLVAECTYPGGRWWKYENDGDAATVGFYADQACTEPLQMGTGDTATTTRDSSETAYARIAAAKVGQSNITISRVKTSATGTATEQLKYTVNVYEQKTAYETVQLSKDAGDNAFDFETPDTLAGSEWKVSSLDESIATVAITAGGAAGSTRASLEVTALAAGSTKIFASNGVLEYTIDLEVLPLVVDDVFVTIIPDDNQTGKVGETPVITYTFTVDPVSEEANVRAALESAGVILGYEGEGDGTFPIVLVQDMAGDYKLTLDATTKYIKIAPPYIQIAVPTAEDLTYNGNEQTGVVASVGFTLTDNVATNAGSYTATAKLADGYCWTGEDFADKYIAWSIAKAAVTVTADDADKLVGADDPDFEATVSGLFGDDEIVYSVARTNMCEDVGSYDIVATGAAVQGSYDITYVTGKFEIRAGKITVNGKGFDDISEAINNLKQNGGRAVCNDDIDWYEKGIKFSNGAVLEYDREERIFTVTGNMTVPAVNADEVIVVNGALTLNGDLYADDEGAANVAATNVVLGADVTVGETEGEETEEIAVLAFDEIDVNGHKLTLTVNGLVRSATALETDAVFAEAPDGFKIVETPIDGGYEYKLEELAAITITIKAGEGVEDVQTNGVSVVGDFELPADATEVELTLKAPESLTIPLFKVVRDNETNVTAKVATYAIEDGDTLEFIAEEAKEDDEAVTPEQRKQAIIDAIDPPEPDDPDDEERYQKAKAKVEAVVGDDTDQVSAKDFAVFITENGVPSREIAENEYVVASVKLGTDGLIDEETEVEIVELVKAEGDALTFAVNIDEDKVAVEAIKDMVEASSDLTDWAKNRLEVKAEFDEAECKVTVTPKDPTDKAFMKVVIPHDTEVK